ncbi:MAG: hypothetical protein PVG24_05415, partial [Gammaproteobacteria bacterium]
LFAVTAGAGVPGFLSATRYVCRAGFPRYLAVYDLETADVLKSDAYRAIAGENLSIWTKRAERTVRGYFRVEGTQVYPGDAVTLNLDSRAHLTVVRFIDADEATLLKTLQGVAAEDPNIAQFRLYRNAVHGGQHIALFEHTVPVDSYAAPKAFLTDAVGRVDLINTYSPYWRR